MYDYGQETLFYIFAFDFNFFYVLVDYKGAEVHYFWNDPHNG